MKKTTGSLQGIKVVDLTRVLGGPYCSQILADHGADVLKIEPPSGDETRTWGPPFLDDTAAYFSGVNRNKRGMVLDLAQEEGRQVLLQLLETADVLLENFKTGTLERWNIGYQQILRERFPRLIHCSISGFGTDGPLGGLPGYDAVIQAMAGLMSVNGEADGEPLRVGLPVVDMVTGLNAANGVLMALHERQSSGQGQSVEVTLYDAGLSLMHPHLPNYFLSGKVPQRSGNAHPNIAPYDTYKTNTTDIFLAVGNDRQFSKLCGYLRADVLLTDSRFSNNGTRCEHRKELKLLLEGFTRQYDCESLANQLVQLGVPCGPVQKIDAVVAHPHTRHREMIVRMGDYQGVASPVKLSRTPASYRMQPPTFGQDSHEVLQELGFDTKEIEQYEKNGVTISGSRG